MTLTAELHDTGTVLSARADARGQDGAIADAMAYVPASTTPYPPDGVDPDSLVWAETVAAGGYTHRVVARGTRIRLTDVDGEACAHVIVYNADQPWERLNVADTQKIPWQAYLGAGHPLLSGDGRVLASIVGDESLHHDALCGTTTDLVCDEKYGAHTPDSASPSGRALFTMAATKHALTPRDLPPSVSFFKGVHVEPDGALTFTGSAGAGRSVDLIAELPLIILVANTPHPIDPRPEFTCGRLRINAWPQRPTGPGDPLWDSSPESHRAYLNSVEYAESRGL